MSDFSIGTPWSGLTPPRLPKPATMEADINAGTLRDGIQHRIGVDVTASAFDAPDDGVADATAEVQAAIDYAEANNYGTVWFPYKTGGDYLCGALRVKKGIQLIAEGPGSVWADATEHNTERLVKISAAETGTDIITFEAAGDDESISGAGMYGFLLRSPGENPQSFIKLVNGTQCHFRDLQFGNHSAVTGSDIIWIANKNAATNPGCSWNVFERLYMTMSTGGVGGVGAGIRFDGQVNTGGGTPKGPFKNFVRDVFCSFGTSGETYNFIELDGAVDNNFFSNIHTSRATGHLGYTVYARNGTSSSAPPRFNRFDGLHGHVYEESEARGNVYYFYSAETSSYTRASGATGRYFVTDNGHADTFETRKYTMSGKGHIPCKEMTPTSTATKAVHGSGYVNDVINMPVSADTGGEFQLMGQEDWADGNIVAIGITYGVNVADTGLVWRCTTNLKSSAFGETLGSGFTSNTNDLTLPTVATNAAYYVEIDITDVVYTRGDVFTGSINREGTHANDTATGAIQIMSIDLIFESAGPNSSSAGTPWQIPARYLT